MVVEGTIKSTGLVKVISDKFQTRSLVLETDDMYPQLVEFQATNDMTRILDNFIEGDKVSINFNLRGREWKSPSGEVKYFNTLQIWKIELVSTFGNLKNKNNFAEESKPEKKHWSGLSGEVATGFLDDQLDNEYAPEH